MPKHVAMVFLLGFCLIPLAGCNSNAPTYKVEGTVEFEDGTRPKFGNIEFYSPQFKINARGKINRDGAFTVTTFDEDDGAVIGYHDIVIMQQVGSYLLAKTESTIKHDHGSLIDKRHFDYRTSGLSCNIENGTNEILLVVKKLPRQTKEGMPH